MPKFYSIYNFWLWYFATRHFVFAVFLKFILKNVLPITLILSLFLPRKQSKNCSKFNLTFLTTLTFEEILSWTAKSWWLGKSSTVDFDHMKLLKEYLSNTVYRNIAIIERFLLTLLQQDDNLFPFVPLF